ncbi:unnamed protein product, partial [Porites evermanni]
ISAVLKKKDVFVSLPTGFGKSVIFQALPMVFDSFTGESGHIVIVVSPLLSLIKDQTERLRQVGISCVSLSDVSTQGDIDLVEGGFYSVVYATPESLLKNERWRRMLSSNLYQQKVCAIAVDEAHVIKQWGTSTSSKLAPFRECYESPEKPNVSYVVEYMQRDKSLYHQFEWLVEEINKNGLSTERTIIYCQTIQQCSHIYSTLKSMIGDTIYAGKLGDNRNVLLEMLHSCSPPSNKVAVLKSFQDPKGVIRILVATIAFGMGVDCRAVHRTIHFGPSKNLKAFVQESDRAGRDGKPSVSYLLYHGLLLTHVEKDIKNFIHTKDCRRKFFLKEFNDTSAHTTVVVHLCCDNCSKNCGCGSANCNLLKYPSKKDDKQPIISRERDVSDSQKQQL